MADDTNSTNLTESAGQAAAAAAMLQESTNNNSSGIRGTIHEDVEDSSSNFDADKQRQIELEEEKKLKARHPCIQRPGSEFLQKRLQRGQKYFDSGDYNMAKASTNNSSAKLPDNATPVTAIDSKIHKQRH